MRRKTGAICIAISILLLILFIFFQFTLPGRLSHEFYVSSSVQSYYDTSALISESSILSSDSVSEPITSEDPKTVEPVESFMSTEFQPVGLPFSRKNWYKLFRYYQQKQYNVSSFYFQHHLQEAMESSKPWSLLESRYFDIVYIREGCIDLRQQLLIIMNPSSSTQFEKKYLRNPETLESHIYSDVKIPGFEFYHLYQVDASIPKSIPVHSSNFSWILATPPSSQDSCLQSFFQYVPVFLQSIIPFFKNDV
jgi:hypothetical protein